MAKKLSEGRKAGSGRKPGTAKTLAEGRKVGSGRKKGSVSKTLADGRKVGSGRKKGSSKINSISTPLKSVNETHNSELTQDDLHSSHENMLMYNGNLQINHHPSDNNHNAQMHQISPTLPQPHGYQNYGIYPRSSVLMHQNQHINQQLNPLTFTNSQHLQHIQQQHQQQQQHLQNQLNSTPSPPLHHVLNQTPHRSHDATPSLDIHPSIKLNSMTLGIEDMRSQRHEILDNSILSYGASTTSREAK